MFLFYGDEVIRAKHALQRLIIGSYSQNAPTTYLSEWVNELKNENWKCMLLEGLNIIKAKRVLRKLGLHLQDLEERFMAHNSELSLFVHPVLKSLYFLCENLVINDSILLIKDIQTKFSIAKQLEFSNEKYLEIFLLHWLSERIIEAGEWWYGHPGGKKKTHCNVKPIIHWLKQQEKITLKEQLMGVSIKLNFTSKNVIQVDKDKNLNKIMSKHQIDHNNGEVSSLIETKTTTVTPINKKYVIRKQTAGYILIINQTKFEYNPLLITQLKPRKGTDKDSDELKKVFSSFGYTVITKVNVKSNDILNEVNTVVNQSKNADSLVICILSHGEEGTVFGSDSKAIEIQEIKRQMASEHFLGKPKILIMQSCQGNITQQAIQVESKLAHDGPDKSTSLYSDMFEVYSTIVGFTSLRDEVKGSWLIQTLCKHIYILADSEHFLSILTTVINEVSAKRGRDHECMVPYFSSTLTKYLYLPQRQSAK